jgi:hypothetical protein
MRSPTALVPRIALTLDEAATACGVSPALLKGQIHHGYLPAKRTSPPQFEGVAGLTSWTGGRYLIGVKALVAWRQVGLQGLEDA